VELFDILKMVMRARWREFNVSAFAQKLRRDE
jgi:hypothetical protein